jgi:hypothetical protein
MGKKRPSKKPRRARANNHDDSDHDDNWEDERINFELAHQLLQACEEDNIGQAESLLKLGAHAWMQDDDGWTSLHFAAGKKQNSRERLSLLCYSTFNVVT